MSEFKIICWIVFGIASFLIVFCLGVWLGVEGGYQAGQIDAIKGKIIYKIVNKTETIETWEKIHE